jgi:hypothetical protein
MRTQLAKTFARGRDMWVVQKWMPTRDGPDERCACDAWVSVKLFEIDDYDEAANFALELSKTADDVCIAPVGSVDSPQLQ